jgi:hypothetical protein
LSFNDEQDDITLGFFLTDASNKDWKLRITRIPCSSQDLGLFRILASILISLSFANILHLTFEFSSLKLSAILDQNGGIT